MEGHASAERAPTGKERQPGRNVRRLRHRRANRLMAKRRRIGPTRTALHVRKLIAQRRDAERGELARRSAHEGMIHAGARAVSEYIAGARGRRPLEARGDAQPLRYRQGKEVADSSAGLAH
jgi:hypothetical protein